MYEALEKWKKRVKKLRLVPNKKIMFLKVVFHSAGIGCIGGALLFEVTVLYDIATQGYCIAVESNTVILLFEFLMAGFGIIYLIFLVSKLKIERR